MHSRQCKQGSFVLAQNQSRDDHLQRADFSFPRCFEYQVYQRMVTVRERSSIAFAFSAPASLFLTIKLIRRCNTHAWKFACNAILRSKVVSKQSARANSFICILPQNDHILFFQFWILLIKALEIYTVIYKFIYCNWIIFEFQKQTSLCSQNFHSSVIFGRIIHLIEIRDVATNASAEW